MNNRHAPHYSSFISNFVDAVTVRPFLDDLARMQRAANLRASLELSRTDRRLEDARLEAA